MSGDSGIILLLCKTWRSSMCDFVREDNSIMKKPSTLFRIASSVRLMKDDVDFEVDVS